MSSIVSAEHLRIIGITIDSERFNRKLFVAGGINAGIVVEVNIYENLQYGYLTGSMILSDDQDIYRSADLVGTERVIIDFESPDKTSSIITKTFIIEEIDSNVKNNDYNSSLFVSLIEDIKYYDQLNKFSKAYTGTGEQIIQSIVEDKLKRPLIIESEVPSVQDTFRYISPYNTPLQAISSVRNKMSTETGMPFFFYSSLVNDNLYLTDLETIIRSEPFNAQKPFVYDQSNTHKNDIESMAVNITSYNATVQENTLEVAMDGGMGHLYESVNISTGQNFLFHIDMADWFQRLRDAEMFPRDQAFIAFDKEFRPDPTDLDGLSITDYDSKIISQVVTNPYNDVQGFYEESYPGQETLYGIKRAVVSHLLKNTYTINLPGLLFSVKNIKTCVGHQISMEIYKNDIDYTVGNKIDEKRSGNFVILSKRHIFDVVGERHNVSLGIAKLASRRINR